MCLIPAKQARTRNNQQTQNREHEPLQKRTAKMRACFEERNAAAI